MAELTFGVFQTDYFPPCCFLKRTALCVGPRLTTSGNGAWFTLRVSDWCYDCVLLKGSFEEASHDVFLGIYSCLLHISSQRSTVAFRLFTKLGYGPEMKCRCFYVIRLNMHTLASDDNLSLLSAKIDSVWHKRRNGDEYYITGSLNISRK